MKSLEEYLKAKHPLILDEYNKYKAEEIIKEKEKNEKAKAEVRKNRRFWEYDFEFDVEYSYKGWTDGDDTKFICFDLAFNLFSDDELARKLKILMPGDKSFEEGETFAQILEYAGIKEKDLKKDFKKFLYEKDYSSLSRFVENHYDYETRVCSEIEWTGFYYWDKSHFEEIWAELKSFRFKEGEVEEEIF